MEAIMRKPESLRRGPSRPGAARRARRWARASGKTCAKVEENDESGPE